MGLCCLPASCWVTGLSLLLATCWLPVICDNFFNWAKKNSLKWGWVNQTSGQEVSQKSPQMPFLVSRELGLNPGHSSSLCSFANQETFCQMSIVSPPPSPQWKLSQSFWMSQHGRHPLGVCFPSVCPGPGGCWDTFTFNLPGMKPAVGLQGHWIMNLGLEEGLPLACQRLGGTWQRSKWAVYSDLRNTRFFKTRPY